jgi:hypothetical protein
MRGLLALLLLAGPLAAQSDEAGFVSLFDGRTLDGWFVVNRMGPGFLVENGLLVCPREGGQKLMTDSQYANFVFRFEFRLEPDANNGIGIRAPRNGHTATQGMEIQIFDDNGPANAQAKLRPEQYHGSIYDVLAARRGFLKKAGEWNRQEISALGRRIAIRLNGETILDADLDSIRDPGVLAKHPGLGRTSGHIALLGHQSRIEFRNLRIKALP